MRNDAGVRGVGQADGNREENLQSEESPFRLG